jgi:hypothetical protein
MLNVVPNAVVCDRDPNLCDDAEDSVSWPAARNLITGAAHARTFSMPVCARETDAKVMAAIATHTHVSLDSATLARFIGIAEALSHIVP